jgi:hypothetical protein
LNGLMIASTFFISLLSVAPQTGRAGHMPAPASSTTNNHSLKIELVQAPKIRARQASPAACSSPTC